MYIHHSLRQGYDIYVVSRVHHHRPKIDVMRTARIIAASFAVVLVTAQAASAHPAYRPQEVVAGEDVEVELVIAHDCEGSSGGSPTTVVELDVPPEIVAMEPLDVIGWTSSVSDDGAGQRRIEWTADDERVVGEPPTFGLRLTAGKTDETVVVPTRVFQGCPVGDYRWGVAADEPSVDLIVSPGTNVARSAPRESATSADFATDAAAPAPTPTHMTGAERDEASPAATDRADSDPATGSATMPAAREGSTALLWWGLSAAAILAVTVAVRRRHGSQ